MKKQITINPKSIPTGFEIREVHKETEQESRCCDNGTAILTPALLEEGIEKHIKKNLGVGE